ncbi:uncharacterized protein LOC135814073 [Sycon ciliatum]|uniref:uncharacterized protein LOC135814073 n=1 Tax=Sycon ciliatum TaxID=27933 RepID=UPI0031F6B32F
MATIDPCSSKGNIRVGFIGAGAVNFGGTLGPWDHASRLEKIEQVRFVAICDAIAGKAEEVLAGRKNGANAGKYEYCTAYEDYKLMLQQEKLDAVFIGVPPFTHGHFDRPIELDCVRAGVHCFVEKPLSVKPVAEVDAYMQAVLEEQKRQNLVVSVGYMFRYHPAIRRMKQLILEHSSSTGAKLTYLQLTYKNAYNHSTNYNWWRKELSGGPVVEQATHFCDMARFIAGDIVDGSIRTKVLCHDHPSGAGRLHSVPDIVREYEVAEEERVPRVTVAHWRFNSGAIGQLSHGAQLHGRKYEACLEAWADGLRISVDDPYTKACRLAYRQGDTDDEVVERFPDADAYMEEDKAFISAVCTGNHSSIESMYEDAMESYSLSWSIRSSSESLQAKS